MPGILMKYWENKPITKECKEFKDLKERVNKNEKNNRKIL